jgi:hypothetical protein
MNPALGLARMVLATRPSPVPRRQRRLRHVLVERIPFVLR